jgi:Family of unknown function (DUF5706)
VASAPKRGARRAARMRKGKQVSPSLRAGRRNPAEIELVSSPGYVLAELLLSTLEERRTQLIGRATVLTAADSALVLAYFQFILSGGMTNVPELLTGAVGACLAAIALVQGLRMIGGVSGRDGRKTGGRVRKHLLFFETAAESDPAEMTSRLLAVRQNDVIEEMSLQATSLARILKRRYDALKRSFRLTAWSVVVLLISFTLSYDGEILSLVSDLVRLIRP